jgi:membrane-associated phospholipid phosphatase
MAKRIVELVLAGLVVSIGVARASPAAASDGDSVYEIDPVIDGAVIGGSVALVISLYTFAAGAIDTRCPCDRNEVNSFDRFAVGYHSNAAAWASNVTAGLAFIAPPVLDWLALGLTRPLVEDLTVYAETFAVSGALVVIAKQIAQRPFPRTYQGDPTLVDSPNGYRSFYSGHSTLVFAALTTAAITIHERYGPSWIPWAVAAAVGTGVSIARVAAGWHFPTDAIVGAVAGAAVGTAVPLLHLRRLSWFPFVSAAAGERAAGLAVAGHWS